jgi:peptide chain release factor subunit 1
MITYSDVEKLLGIQAAAPSVLSVYLWVPVDPAALRSLPARAGELLALAGGGDDDPGTPQVRDEDRQLIERLLEIHGRDWMGHTVALFACGQLGLSEAIPLPCRLQDRAVLAARPHVRPLLLALQRCPDYHVALVDRRHAWVFRVAGERIDMMAQATAEGVRSHGFGGWYGLDSYRVNERIIQLARHHYRDTAAVLQHAMPGSGQAPLVVGGHEETIPQFLAALPATVRDGYAGSFVADPHAMTPARVRALAGPVIGRWVDARDQRLIQQIRQEAPGLRTAMGLSACLDAVSQHAVKLLVVPVGGLIPGFACRRCGALTSTGAGCPDGAPAQRQVPDLIEEMVVTAIGDGAEAVAVSDPPAGIAARLRFPLTWSDGR